MANNEIEPPAEQGEGSDAAAPLTGRAPSNGAPPTRGGAPTSGGASAKSAGRDAAVKRPLEQTRDDTDAAWGEWRDESGHDAWLQEQRPPHWE